MKTIRIRPKRTKEYWREMANRFLGKVSDDEAWFVLWNETAYPFAGPIYIARQLKLYAKNVKSNLSV